MENNFKISRIKTHIRGLDDILHGGIACHSGGAEESGLWDDGVLISINGERGVNKPYLALHMCHGIARSVSRNGWIANNRFMPVFYSLNRTEKMLKQEHENAAISRLLNRGIQDFIIDKHDGDVRKSLLCEIVSTFFSEAVCSDKENQNLNYAELYKGKDEEICDLLVQGTVVFNSYSRTLNFKHLKSNSGLNKIRRFSGFVDKISDNELIKEYLLPIDFNGIDNQKTTKFISRLEDVIENLVELYDKYDENKSKNKLPCLVIDGLSQLTDDELQTIPIDYLQRILRKVAYVAILVFDERGNSICRNSDLIIELKHNTDKDVSSLSYNTLEITKCMKQNISSGKHLYKKTRTGISVFPSLEHRLNYDELKSDTYSDLQRGLFNTSYGSYLKRLRSKVFNNVIESGETNLYTVLGNTIESSINTFNGYILLNERFKEHYIEVANKQATTSLGERTCERLLNHILFRSELPNCGVDGFEMDNLITSLVSYKNCYKRTLSNAVIFNALHSEKESLKSDGVTNDVLYISFNNNRQQLLRTVACPCLGGSCRGKCNSCYDRIHLYSVPFGDISASELIFLLDDIVRVYNRVGSKHVICHILIDDLNCDVVKNAHPFIYKDRLLVPALFKMLRGKQIPTTIISDVSENGNKEVCDFADNVIFTKRRRVSNEPYKELLDVYVTKDYRYCNPRKLYGCSLKISDYKTIIEQNEDTFVLKKEAVVNDREVSPLEMDFLYDNV